MVCELSASEKDAIQKFISIHKHCVRKLLNKGFLFYKQEGNLAI